MVSKPVTSITGTTEYEQHDPIKISNDNDFKAYGFEGFGTPDEPYLIDGYNITDSTTDLIRIDNTVVYFKISNCYLNGLVKNFRGIVLGNVAHGIIDSNIICNPDFGIVLGSSSSNTLSSNTIYNCKYDGIRLHPSNTNNVLSNNTIYNCLRDGISQYWFNNYNTLFNNTIYNCADDAIELSVCNNYHTISSNTIYNCSYGINFDNYNHYNTLSSNIIYDCSSSGIFLGMDSNHSILSSNTVYNVNGGISVVGSHCTLSSNTVYNATGGAISMSQGLYCTLSNNTVYKCNSGITQYFSNYCTLSNNTVYDCSYMCLSLYNSNHCTLSSNTFYNCTQYGVLLRDSSSYNTLYNNTISHCSDWGIYFYGGDSCSYNTLSYNTIDDCSRNCIYLDWTSDSNTLSYNTISNCSGTGKLHAGNGIVMFGSNHSTLFSNVIYNCSINGIYLDYSHHNTLSSNMISNCSSGISLDLSSNYNTLSGNMISNCSNDGIFLYQTSDDNTLSHNTISHCSDNGIELYYVFHNTLSYNAISNCSNYGVGLFSANDNFLYNNTIYNNTNYGFYFGISDQSNDNIAQWNNFLNNSEGTETAQACDDRWNDAPTNVFSENYWHDYIPPPGYYTLDTYSGSSIRNNDTSPLATPGPPLVSIVTPFAQDYSADVITVILSGNAVQYWYYIEGIDGDNQTWRTREERTLDDGTYTLHAYGKILRTITHVSVTFTIDTTPPTFNIDSPTSKTYTTGTITVDLSGDADIAYYWYYIEGFHVDNQIWTTPISWTLADGAYILHTYAIDTVGNIAYFPVAFKIETVAPIITLKSPSHDTSHNSMTIIKLDVIDVFLDTVLYNWDGSTNKTWNQDYEFWTLLPSGDAQHFLYVYANDSLGRWTSEVFTFTTDDTNPTVDITSPTNDTTYDQDSVTLAYTVSEGTVTVYINGVTKTVPSGTIFSNLSNGIYNITITAVDQAGNIGTDTIIFIIEIVEEESSETTSETSSETTTKTESSSEVGSFPSVFILLLFIVPVILSHRRYKRKS